MTSLLLLIVQILDIYKYVLIAAAVLSWLIAFDVMNTRNHVVYRINDFLNRVTEPVLRPIRRFLPNLEGIDISPVILLLAILLIQQIIIRYIYPNVF